jgi:hypothetical protein
MRVHSAVLHDRLLQYTFGSVTLASPLIFFHGGTYNNNSPGTFRYHLVLPKRNMHYVNLIQVIATLIRLDCWTSVSFRQEV